MAILHVRVNGESNDLPIEELDLSRDASDNEIREKVATYFNKPLDVLNNFSVNRNENGDITVSPAAVFGYA